jgi:hypothetical protein
VNQYFLRRRSKWTCLYQESRGISTVTAMTYDPIGHKLFLAGHTLRLHIGSLDMVFSLGWAATKSEWPGSEWRSPYAIAVANLDEFIDSLDSSTRVPTTSATKRPANKSPSPHSSFFHPSTRSLKTHFKQQFVDNLSSQTLFPSNHSLPPPPPLLLSSTNKSQCVMSVKQVESLPPFLDSHTVFSNSTSNSDKEI